MTRSSTAMTTADRIRELAAQGLYKTQIARELGLTITPVSLSCKRHGIVIADMRADPQFAERHRERMKALNADPAFNPLSALTPAERADYDILVKKGGLKRPEALKAIGRADMVRT